MRTSEQIANRVAGQIHFVYARPLLHADRACIDQMLYAYHWVWAMANEAEHQLSELTDNMYVRENAAGGMGLWTRFKMDNPASTDDEALGYVLTQWRNISDAMGIPATSPDTPRQLDG